MCRFISKQTCAWKRNTLYLNPIKMSYEPKILRYLSDFFARPDPSHIKKQWRHKNTTTQIYKNSAGTSVWTYCNSDVASPIEAPWIDQLTHSREPNGYKNWLSSKNGIYNSELPRTNSFCDQSKLKINLELTATQKEEILVSEYSDCFACNEDCFGVTNLIEHTDLDPVYARPFPVT